MKIVKWCYNFFVDKIYALGIKAILGETNIYSALWEFVDKYKIIQMVEIS